MHLMYVDESGDCGYPADGSFPPVGGPTRHFVRAGVVVHAWRWFWIDNLVADFKRSRRLRWDAEIKATDLRAGKGAFAHWSSADRRQFVLDLLDSIGREIDVRMLMVAIDKAQVDLSQRERFTNPSVRSLELLLERHNRFLADQPDKSGIAILDSVEARNDENLRYFQNYLLTFSDHIDRRRIVEGTLFMASRSSNLLQLADVCTNVCYRKLTRDDGNADEWSRIRERVVVQKLWPEKEDAAKDG